MRVGFIGAGRMAQRRLLNLPQGWEPVAVYDKPGARVDVELARDQMEALHVGSPEEVIDASDLVIVATTHSTLAAYGHQIVDAGKQAFIEKPGGVPGDSLPVARYGFNHRFWPGIRAARAEITGRVLHIRGVYGHGNADRLWRMDPALSGGGELIDQGSHLIDLARTFLGDLTVRSYHGSTGFWPTDVEDTAVLVVEGEGVATLQVSWCEWEPLFRWEILTENERIRVEGFPWKRQECAVTNRDGSQREFRWWGNDQSLLHELEDVDSLVGATQTDAAAVLHVIQTCYQGAS